MPAISVGDKNILEAGGHRITPYISFLVPRDLWSARVNNASAAHGDRAIVFDGGSGLSFTAVEAVQEVWVGSSAGDDDIGRARIKSITSGDSGVTGTVTVAANSFNWADDQYLTFKHDYPLKPIRPYIDSGGDFYKDFDIAYSDQNEEPPPICIAGTHRAQFMSGGSAVFNIDLSDSYAVANGATISSYASSVYPTTGVTDTVSTATGLGSLTFTSAGQFWAKFSCTDSNGKTQNTYRCFFVHSTDPASSDYPFVGFSFNSISGDWESGGWECGIQVADNAALTEIPDKTIAVFWAEWEFGDTTTPITFLPDDDNALLVGYVRKEQIKQNIEDGVGNVSFSITTVESLLRQKYNYSVSLEAVTGVPNKWYKYENWLTTGRALHHLYKWHSTLFEVSDFIGLLNDTTARPYAEFEDETLYAMGDSTVRHRGTREHITCDRGGRLHLVKDSQLLPNVERAALTETAEILRTDQSGEFVIRREPENVAPFVYLSGIYWDGTFDGNGDPDADAICAIAPGNRADDDGPTPINVERQTLTGQTQANNLAGRYLAAANNEYPEYRVDFHGNYLGVLEPALGEYWKTSYLSTETVREIVWGDKHLFLRSVSVNIDTEGGTVACSTIFEPEADGDPGVTTTCPTFPPLGGDDFEIPEPSTLGGAVVTASSVDYLPPQTKDWTQRTSEATSCLYADPHWPVTQSSEASANAILWRGGVGYVKRSTNAGVSWTTVTPSTNPPNDAGDAVAPTVANITFAHGEGSWINDHEHVFIATWQNAASEWRSWIAYTDDDGSTWEWKSIADYGAGSDNTFGTSTGGNETASTHPSDPTKHIIALSSTKLVIVYFDTSPTNPSLNCVVGTVSGETVTYGTVKVIEDNTRADPVQCTVELLDTDKFVVAYKLEYGGSATDEGDGILVVGSVSGTTITIGSKYTFIDYSNGDIGTATSWHGMKLAKLSTTKMLLTFAPEVRANAFAYVNDGFHALTINISGTSISSIGTIYQFLSGTEIATVNNVPLSSTSVVVALGYRRTTSNSNIYIYGAVLSVSGDTISIGSSYAVENTITSCHGNAIASHASNAVVFIHTYENFPTSWPVVANVGTVSGTSITVGTDNVLFSYDYADGDIDSLSLEENGSGKLLFSYKDVWNSYPFLDQLGVSGNAVSVAKSTQTSTSAIDGSPRTLLSSVPLSSGSFAQVFTIFSSGLGSVVITGETGNKESKVTGMSLGKGLGETLYVTGLDITTEELFLQAYDLTDLSLLYDWLLSDCTEAQLNANTYVAYPYSPFTYDDAAVYVFGRMDDPAGLGSPSHIIYSDDFGVNFDLIEGAWSSDHCGSLIEDFGTIFAIRNLTGSSKLYVGDIGDLTVAVKSTLLFAYNVNPKSMAYTWYDDALYVAADTGNAIMVLRSSSPFEDWEDVTYDHPTTNGVNAVETL